MQPRYVHLCLFMTYFIFAMLLNSVGTVILQVINNYGVSKTSASVLEAFKDLSIAIVSFSAASLLPRLGFRYSMMLGLALVTAACAAMPLIPSFITTKLLFFTVGTAFALVKVSVYSTVGLVCDTTHKHASLLNTIEGVFMIGVLCSYWLFGFFIDADNPHSTSWLNVYWVLAAICLVNIAVLAMARMDESAAKLEGAHMEEFIAMLKLMARPIVIVFVISAFLYVLIEQGIGTWLPTFNNQVLKLPANMSVQATSIFAACLAAGRLGAGALMRRIHWYPVLLLCVIAMGVLVLLTLPMSHGIAQKTHDWLSAPLAAYIFPLIGLFMAPIYPAINSVILSALPTRQHAAMTGLIVIFSALGGTTGSIVTGYNFQHFSGATAFYMSLLPIGGLLISLTLFRRETAKVSRI